MKSVKKVGLLAAVFFLVFSHISRAFPADTLVPEIPTRMLRYTENDWSSGIFRNGIDTSFNALHQPDSITAENGKNLGVMGSPSQLLYFQPSYSPFATTGLTLYYPYLQHPEKVEYLRTNKRFTRLNYHMGSFREQSIEAYHSQNIVKNWNAGIQFYRFNVKDFLIRSDSYYNRFLFFTDYASRNQRYHLFANCYWNNFKNQLNGGVAFDSLISGTDNSHLDLKGLPVMLSAAGNRFREKSFHAGQYFRLDRPQDTATRIIELQISSTLLAGSLTYYDQLTDTTQLYTDYFSGLTSYDSIGYRDFRNRAGISFRSKRPAGKGLHTSTLLFVEHQLFDYWQRMTTNRTNLATGGKIGMNLNRWELNMSAHAVVSGDDQGNYCGEIGLKYTLPTFSFGTRYEKLRGAVPLSYLGFSGNHFNWSNDFLPVDHARASAFLAHAGAGFSLELFNDRTTGFLFMNREARPEQSTGSLSVTGLQLIKDFKWRKWHLDNRVRYQQTNSTRILHLPKWSLTHHLYWENTLLHGAFILSTGVQLRYISGFSGDAFMPATGFYYLQDSMQTFGTPVVDIITDFKIKSATLFLTCENAAGGLIGNSYQMTPHNPQASRVFRFGIRWFFFDQ